jgi:hypothetical protein
MSTKSPREVQKQIDSQGKDVPDVIEDGLESGN